MLTKKAKKSKEQQSACDELNDFYIRVKTEIPKAKLKKSDLAAGDIILIISLFI